MSHEPGLRFWLRYAEREGALLEDAGDQALLVLPESLQEAAELPEEVSVTSDPDVAREDGAVLLIPGHPALERAAGAVLEEGDVGWVHLPWPASARPGRATLEARARERFHVEHGRIDAAGEPRPAYVPLLRVGAMISYSASLAHRFQEQEEAWVDARTGLAVPDRVLEALRGHPRLPEPDTTHRALSADLALVLAGAHAQLEERASARQASLLLHTRRVLECELARADAYYRGALESIDRRRASGSEERRRLLDAQAEATRGEHARRRREIEEEFQARHEIRPFRLHLVHVPAFVLPVDVRRGSRTFPFAFAWLAAARAFADVRCPSCAAAAALVVGRERLGCESCLPSSAARRTASHAPDAGSPERPRATGPATPARPRLGERPTKAAASAAGESAQARPARASAGARPARPAPTGRRGQPPADRRSAVERSSARAATSGGLERIGNKLALAFWQAVTDGSRWPRKKVARNSPLRALYRLYGRAGPLCALGIRAGEWPSEATATTFPHTSDAPQLTAGELAVGEAIYPYALHWSLEGGKPVVGEVMPGPHPLVLSGRGGGDATAGRLHERAPSPGIELDPVAAAVWRAELPTTGLPLAVRCLATWWRLEDAVSTAHSASTIAAAVAGAVARAAGLRRTRAEAAASYGTDPDAVDRVARELGSRLRLDRARGW